MLRVYDILKFFDKIVMYPNDSMVFRIQKNLIKIFPKVFLAITHE